MRTLILVIALLGLASSGTAFAGNLVSNPFFDTDLLDWDPAGNDFGMSQHWDPLDVDDDPASGSARIEFDPTTASVYLTALYQAFPIKEKTDYTFGAEILLPAPQSTFHKAQVFVVTYESPGCFGNHQGIVTATAFVSDQGNWESVIGELRTPANANCARLSFRIIGHAGDVLTVHYDNAYIFETFELDGIFRDSFAD